MIKSLQGLRSLGMLGIFLFHSGLLLKGTFPVTFFFILSGFVLYYSYNEKINKFDLKYNISWIKKRMIKLYPIHLITFAMSIVIRWEWILKFNINDILFKSILNLSLLQSLYTKQIFPFNGLSWFLSTTFILYIIAIPLILIVKNIKNIKLEYIIIFTLFIQNIIIFINNRAGYELNLYTSPFFRVFDFLIGMLTAKVFIDKSKNILEYKKYNFYEVSIVVVFICMYFISLFSDIKIEYGLTYYSPIFILGIYVFAYEKGNISKLLSVEILQKVAVFSFEFYMVHELILIVFRKVFINLNYHWLIKSIIISIPSFIVSILIAISLNKYITLKSKTNINSKLIKNN